MISLPGDLYLGSCRKGTSAASDADDRKEPDLRVIHACKFPCWRDRGEKELIVRDEHDLYLNMIDTEKPIFDEELFRESYSFSAQGPTLIHCNQGRSRSPSIALYILAMRGILEGTFEEIEEEFRQLYPFYEPAKGIRTFLQEVVG